MLRDGRSVQGAALVILFLLTSALPLRAAESEASGKGEASVSRSIGGLQVTVDPSTGRLVPPTPEQRARLAAALAQMIDHRTEGLEVRRLPNGAHLVDLQGRFQNVEVAVRGTLGEVLLQCIDSPDELESLLERASRPSPVPPPAPEER